MFHVEQYPLGPFVANAYLVWEDAPGPAVIVDACADAGFLLAELERRDLSLEAVLQTHAHGDHIAALPRIVEATGAPVYLHPDAEPMLHSAEANLSAFAGVPLTAPVDTRPIADDDVLWVLGRDVTVLYTPGHAPGSVCYYFEEDGVVFTGDALFRGSIGRTDFPGGSYDTLVSGIREKLFRLPDDVRVYAGHEAPTTIGHERRTNPFVRDPDA